MKQSPQQLPQHVIEQTAKSLWSAHESDISSLVDAVFAFPHRFAIPEPALTVIKQRVSDAEVKFQTGVSSSVTEEQITTVLNDLSNRLSLPEFTRITVSQIRALRMQTLFVTPQFMGQHMANPTLAVQSTGGSASNKSISSKLSPLQSVHLILTLIDQKFMNSDYQVEPDQWERQKLLNVSREISHLVHQQQSPQLGQQTIDETPTTQLVHMAGRRQELEDAVNSSVEKLDLTEGIELLYSMAEKLGI